MQRESILSGVGGNFVPDPPGFDTRGYILAGDVLCLKNLLKTEMVRTLDICLFTFIFVCFS